MEPTVGGHDMFDAGVSYIKPHIKAQIPPYPGIPALMLGDSHRTWDMVHPSKIRKKHSPSSTVQESVSLFRRDIIYGWPSKLANAQI